MDTINILSLETATTVCSVAIHANGELRSLQEIYIPNAHSANLATLVEQALKNAQFNFDDLNAVAVSKGPGSYTGLRIGVSFAKGICFAKEIPLLSVPTLEAMAFGVSKLNQQESAHFCPMIDARRMEIYTGIFDKEGNVLRNTEAVVLNEETLQSFNSKVPTYYFGDGAAKCKLLFDALPNMYYVDKVQPSASNMGLSAYLKFNQKTFEDLAYFEPFYLKDFVAKKPNVAT